MVGHGCAEPPKPLGSQSSAEMVPLVSATCSLCMLPLVRERDARSSISVARPDALVTMVEATSKGGDAVGHVPYRDYVENIPIDSVIIFQANPTTIVCGHNIKPSKVTARARSAKLFPEVFKLPADK